MERTRVQRAVNRLLGRPQLGRHFGELALLVVDDQALCLLETGRGCEERSVRWESALFLSSNAPCAAAVPRVRTDPYRVASQFVHAALSSSILQDRPIPLFLIPSSQRISSTISPRIGKVRGVSHAAPVCAEIILGRRKVPAARKGSRHAYSLQLATNKSVL
jgi:hypothetical protein